MSMIFADIFIHWSIRSLMCPVCPPLQWATVVQKANAEKKTLKPSVSNGEWEKNYVFLKNVQDRYMNN